MRHSCESPNNDKCVFFGSTPLIIHCFTSDICRFRHNSAAHVKNLETNYEKFTLTADPEMYGFSESRAFVIFV